MPHSLTNPFTPPGLPLASPPFAQPQAAAAFLAERGKNAALLPTLVSQCDALLAESGDGGELPAWIETLWPAALSCCEAAAVRYVRKPLPLADNELEAFRLSRRLWLGLALLCRKLAALQPESASLALQRAANALRQTLFIHVQAGHAVPVTLDEQLFALLVSSRAAGVLASATVDPLHPELGSASAGGYLAWAFLWRLLEPQRFNILQLNVLDRSFARWRELAKWQESRGDDPRARVVDLGRFAPPPLLPALKPRWLDVRSIVRKLRQRSEGLRAGESPEALKLGRELSAGACLRLLREVELALSGIRPANSGIADEVALVFGVEHIYALLTDHYLNPQKVGLEASRLAHQRLGMFGFDRVSQLSHAVSRLEVPGETWRADDPYLLRPAGQTPVRHAVGSLLACRLGGSPRLGCLSGLEMLDDGSLRASVQWFPGLPSALALARSPQEVRTPRQAVFLLQQDDLRQIILPPTLALRSGQAVALDDQTLGLVFPVELLERGCDFVRYALRPEKGEKTEQTGVEGEEQGAGGHL